MTSWKTILQVAGCIFLLCFGIPLRRRDPETDDIKERFDAFLKEFNKTYSNDEYKQRLETFKASLLKIDDLNSVRKNNRSALYGITEFSDMTENEFIEKHLQPNLRKESNVSDDDSSHEDERKYSAIKSVRKRNLKKLPLKVDWREKGFVSEVKNQKLCGACWAFCTVQNVETMYAIKTGKLTALSVQEMIDCAENGNNGCNGGDMCSLIHWLVNNNITIEEESSYPLHLRKESCKMKNNLGVKLKDFVCESFVDEDLILTLLAKNGPVAVAINAISWQNYLGGVIQYHCDSSPTHLNHAVQIVGYDRTADIPYYIVRNSWGKNFGDKGYLYIAIGNNICGITNEVSAVTVL